MPRLVLLVLSGVLLIFLKDAKDPNGKAEKTHKAWLRNKRDLEKTIGSNIPIENTERKLEEKEEIDMIRENKLWAKHTRKKRSFKKGKRSKRGQGIRITSLNVESEIQLRYARTVITCFIRNFGSKAMNTKYNAILPANAFISNFSMFVGEKDYVAVVKARKDALMIYNNKELQGAGVGLVEQNVREANLYQVKVNIEPQQEVVFRLTYDELLERKLGLYEHVIHVQPGQIIDDFRITVNINESLPISSLKVMEYRSETDYTDISNGSSVIKVHKEVNSDKSKARVKFDFSAEYQKTKGIENAFKVKYDIDRDNKTNEIQVMDGYFVHFFTPDYLPVLPKHIIFVLDVSGSMSSTQRDNGESFSPLGQLKDAMFTILDDMAESDYFDIIIFSSKASQWQPRFESSTATKASKENKRQALEFIISLQAWGGTNINEALVKAINLGNTVTNQKYLGSDGTQTTIMFLTDGQPTLGVLDKSTIIRNVLESNIHRFSLHSLAFGKGADFEFVKRISNDQSSKARLIYEGSDAALQLENFYREISSPLLSDIKVDYSGDINQHSNVKTFYEGSSIVIAGKIPEKDNITFKVNITAKANNTVFNDVLEVCLDKLGNKTARKCDRFSLVPAQYSSPNFIKHLYGFVTIKNLISKDDIEDRQVALEMALENNFVTQQTSLIVYSEKRRIKPVEWCGTTIRHRAKYGNKYGIRNKNSRQARKTRRVKKRKNRKSSKKAKGKKRMNKKGRKSSKKRKSSNKSNGGSKRRNKKGRKSSRKSKSSKKNQKKRKSSKKNKKLKQQKQVGCKLTLYSTTYYRGDAHSLTESSLDLADFDDRAVSGLVEGSCCWRVYSQTGFTGESLKLDQTQLYKSVVSLKGLFRNLKSAEKIKC